MILFIEWCTVLCIEENKTYLTSAKNICADSYECVKDSDLSQGHELVWHFKCTPYTVEVVDVQGNGTLFEIEYALKNYNCM